MTAIVLSIILALGVLATPLTSQAQRPTTIPRVGFIHPTSATAAGHHLDAFRQGLRDLGYVEGETIALEVRWAGPPLRLSWGRDRDENHEERRTERCA